MPRNPGWFNLSTHFPWIGMRTAQLDGAHVEYCRGISNPMGLKLGPGVKPDQLLRTIDLVKGSLNPTLEIQGVVLTMFDKRNNLSDQVAADVRKHLGEKVYQTVIPRNVRISEAPSHGLPAIVYDHKCAGSQAYIRLASELMHRERSIQAA